MFETTDWVGRAPAARTSRATSWASATPKGILEVIEAGVDMFDCVLPTRTARTGSALTWEGRLNLRNARFARDPRPLDDELRLPGLHRASRGPTSATSSTRTSCSGCACSRSTIYASCSS